MSAPLPPVLPGQQLLAKSGISAAFGTKSVGVLAKVGKLFGFSSPWGVVAWGAVLGGNYLLSRFLRRKPKIDVTQRESTPTNEQVNRRWIMGKQRRVSGKLCYASIVPPTSAAQAVKGSYKSNHFRMIFILSEGSIGDIQGIYLDDSKYIPLEKNGNVLTPKFGYTLPSADVTKFKFPQSHVIRAIQFFAADGASQSSIQTTLPAGRKYHDANATIASNPTTPAQNGWIDDALDSSDMFTDYYAGGANPTVTDPPADQQTPFYLEPKPWTPNHKLKGVSYVAVELFQPFHQEEDNNDDYWKKIPKLEFVVGGLKFTTPANSVAAESENPIDQLYWYDTQVLKIPASKINTASFNTARAICEETVTFQSSQLPANMRGWLGTYRSFKKYMSNHIIEEGEEEEAVHARLLAACAGNRFWYNGQVHYLAGKDTASVLTLTDSELEDITEVRPWPAVSERYNQITAEIPQNRAYNFKEDSYISTDTAARTRDGELRNIDINLECVDHPLQAGYLVAILNRKQRESFRFSAVIPPLDNMDQLKKLIPGATVTITASELGITAKECIVESVQVRADFRVLVIFKLKVAGVYANTLILPPIRPRGIAYPDVIIPDTPTGFTTDEIAVVQKDGTVAVRLEGSWDRSESPITQVQARIKTPAGDWQDMISGPSGIKAYLDNVTIGETYQLRARHWSYDHVESPWTALIENTIDGDLTPPGNITGFSAKGILNGIHATWTNPTDEDFDHVKVYIGTVSNFDRNATTLVAELKSDLFESTDYTAGTNYWISVRPVDRSGNLGALSSRLKVTPTALVAEGQKFLFFSAAEGVNPSVHITASQADINDDALNTMTAELWEKTADPNTWTKRGDLGNKVVTLTTSDPPTTNGNAIGDVAIANVLSENRRLYSWEIDTSKTPPDTTPSWVLKGLIRGPKVSVDDSVPTDSLEGDVFWDANGDIKRRKGDGTDEFKRTTKDGVLTDVETDPEANPPGCRVYNGTWPPNSSTGSNGDAYFSGNQWARKISGNWVEQLSRFTTSTNIDIRRTAGLPIIGHNTEGWRALNPAANRIEIVRILMPSTTVFNYNYETDSWTASGVGRLCEAGVVLPEAPTNFRTTSLTSTGSAATIAFAWDAVANNQGYRIRFVPNRTGRTIPDYLVTAKDATSISSSLFSLGTLYDAFLSVQVNSVWGQERNITFTTPQPAPPAEAPNPPISVTVSDFQLNTGLFDGSTFNVTITIATPPADKPITQIIGALYQNSRRYSSSPIVVEFNYVAGQTVYTARTLNRPPGSNYRIRAWNRSFNQAGNMFFDSQFIRSLPFTIPSRTPVPPNVPNAPASISLRVAFNHDDTESVIATWPATLHATGFSYSWSANRSIFAAGELTTGTATPSSRRAAIQLNTSSDDAIVTFSIRSTNSSGQSSLLASQITINTDNLGMDVTGTGLRAVTGLQVSTRPRPNHLLVSFSFSRSATPTDLTAYEYRIKRKRGTGAFTNISPTTGWNRTPITDNIDRSLGLSNNVFSGHETSDVYLIEVRWEYTTNNVKTYGPESSVSFRLQDS